MNDFDKIDALVSAAEEISELKKRVKFLEDLFSQGTVAKLLLGNEDGGLQCYSCYTVVGCTYGEQVNHLPECKYFNVNGTLKITQEGFK